MSVVPRQRTTLYSEAVVLLGHRGAVFTAKFSPDGTSLVSGGLDASVRFWRLPTDEYEPTPNYAILEGHKSAVTSLAWKDVSTLFSTCADASVAFWDASTGERVRRGVGHSDTVNDCSARAGVSVSVADDGCVCVWDDRTKLPVRTVLSPYPVLCCDLSADGTTAYVSGIDTAVRAIDLGSGKTVWSCLAGREAITGLAVSSDGARAVLRLADGLVTALNVSHVVPADVSRVGPTYGGLALDAGPNLVRVCFSRDDVSVAAGSDASQTFVWNTAPPRLRARFEDHRAAVLDVSFHPTENIILLCSADGDIIVRQMAD